jgi:mannosyl-3-phosphoglycerate phosphatase
MRIVVFTDLDATLLDSVTYSWNPAAEALDALRRRDASVVLVSSKTFAEMELLHRELDLVDPFVVENGGGIAFTHGSPVASELISCGTASSILNRGEFSLLALGAPYAELVRALEEISLETSFPLRGFASMSDMEVASLTGLRLQEAARARIREFDEPFTVADDSLSTVRKIQEAAGVRRLTAVKGGKFWHLLGHHGKGMAVSILIEAYRRVYPRLYTVGLGDSPNDFPFLELVDRPVLLGDSEAILAVPETLGAMRRNPTVGPAGWNEAMFGILDEMDARTPE